MKHGLLLISLYISLFTFCQGNEKKQFDPLHRIDELFIPESLSMKDLFGKIHLSFGYCGYSYILDSNMSYKKTFGCCRGDSIVESGIWTLSGNNTLLLKSNNQSLKFSIVIYGLYYYFITEKSTESFIDDIEVVKKKYKRVLKRFGENAAIDFIHYTLTGKYFSKRISG